MPKPEKPDSEPPETVTSELVKFVEASLSVKVMLADWPEVRLDLLLTMLMVGGMVSASTVLTVMDLEALVLLLLPAASLKVPVLTVMTPVVVLLAVGVKVAV